MRKVLLPVVLTVLILGAMAWAQTIVKANQGQPGTQGPWPVTFPSGVLSIDAGAIQTAPVHCRTTALDAGTVEKTTTVGGTAMRVPSTGVAPGTPNNAQGRTYMNICNSAQNASTAIVKCRQDGVAPVYASGNPGQVLLFGDCMITTVEPTPDAVQCIADAAGREVTSYECIPR